MSAVSLHTTAVVVVAVDIMDDLVLLVTVDVTVVTVDEVALVVTEVDGTVAVVLVRVTDVDVAVVTVDVVAVVVDVMVLAPDVFVLVELVAVVTDMVVVEVTVDTVVVDVVSLHPHRQSPEGSNSITTWCVSRHLHVGSQSTGHSHRTSVVVCETVLLVSVVVVSVIPSREFVKHTQLHFPFASF